MLSDPLATRRKLLTGAAAVAAMAALPRPTRAGWPGSGKTYPPVSSAPFLADFVHGSPPASLAAVRAAPAPYLNSSGVLTVAAPNTSRIDYTGAGAARGLLAEAPASNYAFLGQGFAGFNTSATWQNANTAFTLASATGPDGVAGSATSVTCANTTSASKHLAQAVGTGDWQAVATAGNYIISAVMKLAVGTLPFKLGVASGYFTGSQVTVVFDLVAKTLTLSAANATWVVNGTGYTDLGNGWFQIWVNFTSVSAINAIICGATSTTTTLPNTAWVGVVGQGHLIYSVVLESANNDTGLIASGVTPASTPILGTNFSTTSQGTMTLFNGGAGFTTPYANLIMMTDAFGGTYQGNQTAGAITNSTFGRHGGLSVGTQPTVPVSITKVYQTLNPQPTTYPSYSTPTMYKNSQRDAELVSIAVPNTVTGLKFTFDDASTATLPLFFGAHQVMTPNGNTNNYYIPVNLAQGRRIQTIAQATIASPPPLMFIEMSCDDVDDSIGMMSLVCYLATQGQVRLLGFNAATTQMNVAPMVYGTLWKFGFGHIPMGQYKVGDLGGFPFTALPGKQDMPNWGAANLPPATYNAGANFITGAQNLINCLLAAKAAGQMVSYLSNSLINNLYYVLTATNVDGHGLSGASLFAQTVNAIYGVGGIDPTGVNQTSTGAEYNLQNSSTGVGATFDYGLFCLHTLQNMDGMNSLFGSIPINYIGGNAGLGNNVTLPSTADYATNPLNGLMNVFNNASFSMWSPYTFLMATQNPSYTGWFTNNWPNGINVITAASGANNFAANSNARAGHTSAGNFNYWMCNNFAAVNAFCVKAVKASF